MIMKVGVAAAAVMLLAGCAGSDGAADAAPSTTTATSTRTATKTVTSKPKTKTSTTTATVTQTVTAAAAPAPATPAPQPTSTATTPAGDTTVGPDGVTYTVPTTDEGLEGWCSDMNIPMEVREPPCMGG